MAQRKSFSEKFKNVDLLSFGSISFTAGCFIAVLCIGSLFFSIRKTLIAGFLFGYIFSVINFRLLKSAVEASVHREDAKSASAFVTIRYFLRFIMKFAVLFAGFTSPLLNVVAVIVGLLSVNWAIYLLTLINTKKLNKE
ncbi:MAG: hypothetical protein E7218_07440 [Anaerofustis stercorihominis]|nr:hypothetical protein [Anaerofustis stercorihominis]